MVGRTNLLTRFLTLVVVATAPAVAGLVYLQMDLRTDRLARLRDDVVRQAELVSADVGSIVEGVRQVSAALSHSDQGQLTGAACAAGLRSVRADAPATYTKLLVITASGETICTTEDTPSPAPPLFVALAAAALQAGHFTAGVFMPATNADPAQLPFATPLTTPNRQRAALIAALSVDWLQRHLSAIQRAAQQQHHRDGA